MGGVTLAFNATSDTCDTKDFWAWELDPFTFSTSSHKKSLLFCTFSARATTGLFVSPHRLIFQILPLDERRELEPLGRDHGGVVGAVAEVDRGLRQSALLQFRAQEDRATVLCCLAVTGANNFTLLLKNTHFLNLLNSTIIFNRKCVPTLCHTKTLWTTAPPQKTMPSPMTTDVTMAGVDSKWRKVYRIRPERGKEF